MIDDTLYRLIMTVLISFYFILIGRDEMKAFIEWLVYLLTGAYVIAMAGTGVGLFFGVVWKAFCWVV